MFKTKKDVEKHVRIQLSKLRENEKNLRGLTFATMYFKINEYESALHYVSSYLTVKPDNAVAHKLLGQCLLQLKKPDKALNAFQVSLHLNPKQPDLLIEVCKLFLTNDNLNLNGAKYWCELAEREKVQDDAVFNLNLKLLNMENSETKVVEDMIAKEIILRPHDPNLRIRLVKHLIDENKIVEAFKYVYDMEMKHEDFLLNSIEWYGIVWLTLSKYKQLSDCKKNWDFWLLLIMCLERQVDLSISNMNNGYSQKSGTIEACNMLFNFDQYLNEAAQCILKICPVRELAVQFLHHYRGQLCLHAAALLFKREQTENKNQWRETTKNALPLLLFAYHCDIPDTQDTWLKHNGEQIKKLIQMWNYEGAFRCSQAGRTLLSCMENPRNLNSLSSQIQQFVTDRNSWSNVDDILSQIRQYCSDISWRKNLYNILFPNQLIKIQTSYFYTCQQIAEPIYELPIYAEIESYEEIAQNLKPQSLSHMVYLCLGMENLEHLRCQYFSGLNFSADNLLACGADTLNQLDVETFLYAATIQAKRLLEIEKCHNENYTTQNSGKPTILPFANISTNLCTEDQATWWTFANQNYKNLTTGNLAELRITLQHGIEAVRSGRGFDLIIVLKLGKIFVNRAQDDVTKREKNFLEARAENMYRYALHMLKRKGAPQPIRKLFKYQNANSTAVESEINQLAEEAVTHLAARFFKKCEYEECIDELSDIQLPFAAYFQAEAYRKLDESNKTPRKNKRLYIEKVRECLNQALNYLTLPQFDSNHPLHSVIQSEIKRLQYSSNKPIGGGGGVSNENFSNGYPNDDETLNDSHYSFNSINRSRRETFASPSGKNVEIENLVKQMHTTLTFLKDEIIGVIKPEVSGIKTDMNDLKEKLAMIEENMKKRSDPPSRDEHSNVLDDLYIIDDELQNQGYGAQQSIYSNYSQQQQQQQRMHTPNALMVQGQHLTHHQQQGPHANPYNSSLYNTPFGISCYPQYMLPPGGPPIPGSLPPPQRGPLSMNQHVSFMDPNMAFNMPPQAPPTDSRSSLMGLLTQSANQHQQQQQQIIEKQQQQQQPPPQPAQPSLSQQMTSVPNMWNRVYNNAPVEKGPPVNVVITSSDPLPAHTTVYSQPTLSVTIPPQHIKSNTITNDPLNLANSQGSISFPIATQSLTFGIPSSTSSISISSTTVSSIPTFSSGSLDLTGNHSEKTATITELPSSIPASVANSRSSEVVPDFFKPFPKQQDQLKTNTTTITTTTNKTTAEEIKTSIKSSFPSVVPVTKSSVFTFEKTSTPTSKINVAPQPPPTTVINTTTSSPFAGKTLFSTQPASMPESDIKDKSAADVTKPSPFAEFSFNRNSAESTEINPNKPFANIFANISKPQPTTPAGTTKTTSQTVASPSGTTPQKNRTTSECEEDDYVPTATFEPVITLPDLVEVQTGEENEKPLFEHRAKLLRYDKTNKEWKERGIGNMKILVDSNDVNRVRLVMRREKILKLCCNQRLTKDLKFVRKTDTALTWCGQDYSENELQTETLCIRFKTSETCLKFYDTIIKAQSEMSDEQQGDDVVSSSTNEDRDKKPDTGFGNAFKPKPGAWNCASCYLQNDIISTKCVACDAPKDKTAGNQQNNPKPNEPIKSFTFGFPKEASPVSSSTVNKPPEGFGDKFKPKPGSWSCKACHTLNTAESLCCIACESPKDNVDAKQTPLNVPKSTDSTKSLFNFGLSKDETVKPPSVVTESQKPTQGFGDKFKPQPGSWSCKACYISNTGDKLYCVACESPKDDTVPKKDPKNILGELTATTQKFNFGFGGTVAATTPATIPTTVRETSDSQTPAVPSSGGFLFGNNMNSKFQFQDKSINSTGGSEETESAPQSSPFFPGSTTAPASNWNDLKFSNKQTESNSNSPFNFPTTTSSNSMFSIPPITDTNSATTNTKGGFSFNFAAPTPALDENAYKLEKKSFSFVMKSKSPGKAKSPQKNNSGFDEESDTENVEEENNTYFTPAIDLPDKIEVKTGEEDEETLYCHRAKLYRFVESEWKERGLGNVKILRHIETKKLRVVMRREQILKICLNHALTDDIEYKVKDDKSWQFAVKDFSEGEFVPNLFCLRFKTKEIAENFLQAINESLSGVREPIELGAENVSRSTSITESHNISIGDITEDEIKLAEQLKLPHSFFNKNKIIKCTGCRGCNPDTFVFPEYKELNKEVELEPLPLEMPKLSTSKCLNNSILKESSFSFLKAHANLDDSINSNDKQKQPATNEIKTSIVNQTLDSSIKIPETSFVFNLDTNKPKISDGNDTSSAGDNNNFTSGEFLFGNKPFSFADTAKPVFGQKPIFNGANISTAVTTTGIQKSIFGGGTTSNENTPFAGSLFSGVPAASSEIGKTGPFGLALGGTTGGTTTGNLFGGKGFANLSTSTNSSLSSNNTLSNEPSMFKDKGLTFNNFASSTITSKTDENEIKAPVSTQPFMPNEPIFKTDPGISFSSLAKGTDSTNQFHTSANTSGFIGLTNDDAFKNFLSPDKSNDTSIGGGGAGAANNSQDGGGNEESNYDPHYEPIIELPKEIVVTTGEENEEKLFGQRAVLFRFDGVNNEWKERGVGEMKILYHPTQGTYRLLLRREQIHKCVLNHAITATFQIKLFNNNPKAYCWAANNYAEEPPQTERLAARFKNPEIASGFATQITKCVEELKSRSDLEPEED